MPGLFDTGPSGGIGGILGGLGATLFPGVRQYQLQNMQYELMGRQYDAVKQQFPDMSDAEILGRMQTPGGIEDLFKVKAVPGYKSASGEEAPGYQVGNSPPVPPSMLFPPTAQPPQSVPTAQPNTPQPMTAQPPISNLSPSEQRGVNFKSAVAEGEARAKAAGALQPGFPAALVKAHQTISVLESILNHPDLDKVTGRIAGSLPANASVNPSLVNDIETANNMLLNDTLTQSRNVSGRPVNAGTLKEIRPYDLVKDRVGGGDAVRADIKRAIQSIQDETDAAWVGANSPAEFKPIWGKQQQQSSNTNMPQVGEVRKGHRFLGGNPADPKSWQRVQQQQTM